MHVRLSGSRSAASSAAVACRRPTLPRRYRTLAGTSDPATPFVAERKLGPAPAECWIVAKGPVRLRPPESRKR